MSWVASTGKTHGYESIRREGAPARSGSAPLLAALWAAVPQAQRCDELCYRVGNVTH